MHAELAHEQLQFLHTAIASGRYRDESDALNEAVRLLKYRDELKGMLEEGEKELDAGLGIPAEQVFARLEQRAAELDRNAGLPSA